MSREREKFAGIFYMVTTQPRSCFRYHNIYQYHLTEIFTEISMQMISAQRFPKTARVARLAITCLSHKGQKLRLFWSFDICGDIERASTRGHRARMQFPQNFDICGGIETLERASSHGHRVQMQFPQKFCPLCDKQVITSPLGQWRINFTCIFKVLPKIWENFENRREINP